jgi:hypothetical protein
VLRRAQEGVGVRGLVGGPAGDERPGLVDAGLHLEPAGAHGELLGRGPARHRRLRLQPRALGEQRLGGLGARGGAGARLDAHRRQHRSVLRKRQYGDPDEQRGEYGRGDQACDAG